MENSEAGDRSWTTIIVGSKGAEISRPFPGHTHVYRVLKDHDRAAGPALAPLTRRTLFLFARVGLCLQF